MIETVIKKEPDMARTALTAAEKALALIAKKKGDDLPRGRHSDGRNLYLNVSATGVKSWVFIWKPAAAKWQREMGLGPVDLVSIDEAREQAAAVHRQIRAGIDPIKARQGEKVAEDTFADVMDRVIANDRVTWKLRAGEKISKTEAEYRREFASYTPALLKRRAADITTDDVVAALRPHWATINKTARQLHNRIRKVMEKAKSDGIYKGENPAIFDAAQKLGKLAKKRKKGHAALPASEMGLVLALCAEKPDHMATQGLALIILTAVRTDAARHARWSDIDLDAALWTIPEENNKHDNGDQADGSLVVPLSPQAVALLRDLPRDEAGTDWVFWGNRAGKPVGNSAFKDALRDPAPVGLGYAGRGSVHGMRSVFRTWVGEEGLDREAAELCLGHDLPGASDVEKDYARGQMLERRRKLLNKWADFCLPTLSNDNAANRKAA